MRARQCVRQLAGIEKKLLCSPWDVECLRCGARRRESKQEEKKDAVAMKGSRTAMSTCDVDCSWSLEAGARSHPWNCLETQPQRQMSGEGFAQVKLKGKKCKPGFFSLPLRLYRNVSVSILSFLIISSVMQQKCHLPQGLYLKRVASYRNLGGGRPEKPPFKYKHKSANTEVYFLGTSANGFSIL